MFGRGCRIVGAVVVFAACGGSGDTSELATDEPEMVAVSLSLLSAEEESEGFYSLFDGESLEGWRGYGMDGLPAGWMAHDGVLHFAPPDGEAIRADLMTTESFQDFELRLEWAVSEGGNSGIMFRVTESGGSSYHTGPEYQILDNAGHRDGTNPETSTASNYALHAPSADLSRPQGEFNETRLVVNGPHVEHWLNGEKVVEYTLGDEEWEALVAGSKFAAWEGYGRQPAGHIVLQDHGDEVQFRNVRIRIFDSGVE